MAEKRNVLSTLDNTREKFELACNDAQSLHLLKSFGSAFTAVTIVKTLRDILTNEVMNEVFMPLMNTKIGFLTDATGKGKHPKTPYPIPIVRDIIIEAITIGLLPTGNQFNIISGNMYPTKEGYTYLLKKLNCKYHIVKGYDTTQDGSSYGEIVTTITFEERGEKKNFVINNIVKKDGYSSQDQLQGKAEKKAKKILYEYLTGHDYGDNEVESNIENVSHVDLTAEERKAKLRNKVDLP